MDHSHLTIGYTSLNRPLLATLLMTWDIIKRLFNWFEIDLQDYFIAVSQGIGTVEMVEISHNGWSPIRKLVTFEFKVQEVNEVNAHRRYLNYWMGSFKCKLYS